MTDVLLIQTLRIKFPFNWYGTRNKLSSFDQLTMLHFRVVVETKTLDGLTTFGSTAKNSNANGFPKQRNITMCFLLSTVITLEVSWNKQSDCCDYRFIHVWINFLFKYEQRMFIQKIWKKKHVKDISNLDLRSIS